MENEQGIKGLLRDVLSGNPPIDVRMALSDEDYILTFGSLNPYVEQAMELAQSYPLTGSFLEAVVARIYQDYIREVVSFRKNMVISG